MGRKLKNIKDYDNSWLGNMNAAFTATLYKGKKVVGYCMDTPNAMAFAMKETGATKGQSKFVRYTRKELESRMKNNDMTPEKACLVIV